MRRGLRTMTVGLCLGVLALTSGCSAMNDGSVAPELGADARVGARQTMHRVIDWDGGEAVHRVDATWTDSCGHASNSGFFQPAAGTTCRLDAGAVYTIDGATTPVDAVRIVGPALRAGGLTDEDLVAQAIRPDGSTPSLVDVGGRQSIALGSDVGQDRFAVVRVRGWDQSLGLWQPDGSSVVQSAPGLGVDRRDDAVRASGADYVLVVTHSGAYFTSYDNEPPDPPAPRSSVPPCFSGSNDCVGG